MQRNSGRHPRWLTVITVSLFVMLCAGATSTRADFMQLGVGAHYWRTLKDIDVDNFERSGLAWSLSARLFTESYLSLGLEIEQFPEEFATAKHNVYAPAAYLVLGKGLYGAVGIGGYYSDGKMSEDVFYATRLGLMLEILPKVIFDLNANYRFETWDHFNKDDQKIDTDTITLGAALRIQF